MRHWNTYLRVFIIALAMQAVLFGCFWFFGTDKATGGPTRFGNGYVLCYYPLVMAMLQLPDSIIGEGLTAAVRAIVLGSLIGCVVYSASIALGAWLLRRVARKP